VAAWETATIAQLLHLPLIAFWLRLESLDEGGAAGEWSGVKYTSLEMRSGTRSATPVTTIPRSCAPEHNIVEILKLYDVDHVGDVGLRSTWLRLGAPVRPGR
jgi:hypothetical protein